jgi:hypothetical protein
MKTSTILRLTTCVLLLTTSFSPILNTAQAQTQQEYLPIKDLGLVAYLAEIKILAETKMEQVLNDSAYLTNEGKSKEIRSTYTQLRVYVDQLVLQLIADCKRKNNIAIYRNLDNHFKGNTTIKNKAFEKLLKAIDAEYTEVKKFSFKTENTAALTASVEEITGAVGIVWGIIESARDFREKKVAGLAEMLDKQP